MPKPNISMFGFGKTELGFLKVPDFDFKLETPEPAPTTLVAITGGRLEASLVQNDLKRFVRLDWNCEACL